MKIKSILINNWRSINLLEANFEDISVIIGQKTAVVKNYFKNEIINWKITEYHFFVDYFNENYWLSLHSEFANIVNFEMGVPFNENEEYDWPELSLPITRVWRNGG